METTYITKVFTENTGGGCMVDFVQLESGAVIGINDECVCVYSSLDDFYMAYSKTEPIYLPSREKQLVNEWAAFCDANDIPHESAEDILHTSITEEQKRYVEKFIERWDAACDAGYI